MNVNIPLVVTEHKRANAPAPTFSVRPLFFHGPHEHSTELGRCVNKIADTLRKHLERLGKSIYHFDLVDWTFSPTLEEQHLKTRIFLRRGTVEVNVLVVTFESLDRKLAIMPAVNGEYFEILRGQTVEQQATEVLTDVLNKQAKDVEKFTLPEEYNHKHWLSSVDLDLSLQPKVEDKSEELMAMLGGPPKANGHDELHGVGRCIDWMWPDDLDRATRRDAEVTELFNLLAAPDRRPVLLLGPPKVGKSAVIHDCVRRRVDRHRNPHANRRKVWLLSPQRLISGMMYVGQWESRVTAIVEHAIERDHILYFDDVLGLYSAGKTRDADLTVADVLKPYVERRQFRMLAEMTPEAFRILQEKDRGLADHFHILRIAPTTQTQTREILYSVRRGLEGKHRSRFSLDVLPTVVDLTNRYLRETVQPGKSAELFRELAAKHAKEDIGREQVLAEFRDRSGMSIQFLDDHARLRREEVIEALRKKITGQDEAVNAMADAVCVAKARLNDPGRPLATMLFLGPTGVGKTQCAKAICEFLFGDEKRLLRFDMNEYLDAWSPARLIGTFDEPEGLLTSAIRRQPFSVVLLDEIEKAHPAVFDLLLQVLGEGRLTDALGRTVDFGNAMVIMTSNLGAREAGATFGLRTSPGSARDAYVTAAERFFRPEFFNRLDRIVPFERLTREHVAGIAHRLIGDVLNRDGLVHRQSVLTIEPAAMARVVDQGFHPELGARALKRAIERQLTQPVAVKLAAVAPDAPAVIHVLSAGDQIDVRIETIRYAQRTHRKLDLSDWSAVLDQIEAALDRVAEATADLEPAGKLTQGTLAPAHFRYLAVRELSEGIRKGVERIDRLASEPRKRKHVRPTARVKSPSIKMLMMSEGDIRTALRAAADAKAQLASLELDPPEYGDDVPDQLAELVNETAMLDAIAGSTDRDSSVQLLLRSPNLDAAKQIEQLTAVYRELFPQALGFTTEIRPGGLLLEMPGIARLMAIEHGTHLFTNNSGGLVIVQVIIGSDGSASHSLEPVIRLSDAQAFTIDLRSGLAVRGHPTAAETRKFLLSQLPLPPELEGGA